MLNKEARTIVHKITEQGEEMYGSNANVDYEG
jgi:hypothetical protein